MGLGRFIAAFPSRRHCKPAEQGHSQGPDCW